MAIPLRFMLNFLNVEINKILSTQTMNVTLITAIWEPTNNDYGSLALKHDFCPNV